MSNNITTYRYTGNQISETGDDGGKDLIEYPCDIYAHFLEKELGHSDSVNLDSLSNSREYYKSKEFKTSFSISF